ncbi:von Willebrand factor type A domain protein [Stieleria maiorica]|uniref:von Willebrand factor type A domain protein n=1 Tax=Stieleria maiorica TaxID=2795974 RepID=A0A5B9MGC5_9BACT|nr:VWA domain-containing protein [Stieleria maiorica]QEF98634.1 von Willebrand factor type A domain protein [Stieleria maiorica]
MKTKMLCLATALVVMLPRATTPAADVLVIVDSSGSMQETTPEGISKIDAAKSALLGLPATLQHHDVGVMLFGHRTTSRQPGACQDIELRMPIAPFVQAEYQLTVAALKPLGATPIANSLLLGRDVLLARNRDTPKSVIVVTDGNETCGGDPVAVAKSLREAGFKIKIHVVGFGVDPQQETQLRSIASAGGGEFVLARDASGLRTALTEVVRTALRTTEVQELERNELVVDRFDSEELGAQWTVLRPDVDRYAAIDGELLILSQHTDDANNSPHVGDWHDTDQTKNVVQRTDPIVADDYEVSVDLDFAISSLGQGAALQLRADDRHVIELAYSAHPYGNNIERKFTMCKVLGDHVAPVSNSLATGVAAGSDFMTLKIVKRGFVFTGYVKVADPKTGKVDWREVGAQAAAGFDAARPALIAANGWQNKPEATATFDNFAVIENVFRRTVSDTPPTDAAFFTVFDDVETFHEEFEILEPSASHIGIQHGLNIVSQFGIPGDETDPLKNLVLLDRELPSGNYEIEVQATTRLTNQNSDVGIALFQDHQSALFLGHAAFGGGGYNYNPQLQFEKVLGEDRTGTRQSLPHVRGKQVTMIFKITKKGRKYTAEVYAPTEQKDEMEWIRIGEQTLLRFKPRLGFYAWNRSETTYGRGPAHEVNICFERVVVRSID